MSHERSELVDRSHRLQTRPHREAELQLLLCPQTRKTLKKIAW